MDLAMTTATRAELPHLDDIVDNFAMLEDWEDRYRYVIELGRGLPPMTKSDRCDINKVQGCTSQVWLAASFAVGVLTFSGDSDAHIVRGLVAILLAMVSGKAPAEILAADPVGLFVDLGLKDHLTPQRSNGFRSMVARIRRDAEQAMVGGM